MRREGIDQQLFFHQRLRNIEHRCEDDLLHGVPLVPLLRPHLREPVMSGAPGGRCFIEVEKRSAVNLPPGGELLRIVAVKFNSYSSPRPLPSSGAVRYGAWTRQGPWRRSSAHVARMSGGVAPSDGGHYLCRRLHRHVQPWLANR